VKSSRLAPVGSSNRTRRLLGTLAAVGMIGAAGLTFLGPWATAANPEDNLSTVVLSDAGPGMVAAPAGEYNGPVTPSNLSLVAGSNATATAQLSQGLSSGAVSAYIRFWNRQPANGDAVIVSAFTFTRAAEENAFATNSVAAVQNLSGATPFAVPSPPGASGFTVHTSSSGTLVSEYSVEFVKGDTQFQIVVASTTGDLTSSNAILLAQQQYANAPDIPASGPQKIWVLDWSKVAVLVGGVVLTIAIFVVGRKRKYPPALRGFPAGAFTAGGPAPWAPSGPYPAPPSGLPVQERPKVGAEQWQ
jgi:hypothetical protein